MADSGTSPRVPIRLAALAVVLTATGGLAAAAPASAQHTSASVSQAGLAGSAADDDARRFRESMGFAAEPRSVSGRRSVFGVPMNADEEAELLRRQQVIADDAERLQSLVRRLDGPHALAGVWMDNRAGGRLTVALTRGVPGSVERAVLRAARHRVRVVRASHSRAALEQIASDLVRGAVVDAGTTAAAVDERRNRVRVEVSDDAATAQRRLDTVHPGVAEAHTAVVTASAERTRESPPFRGGQSLIGDGDVLCTSAFVAKAGSPARWYVLTAGHCGRIGSHWGQHGVYVGAAERRAVDGADALAIRIPYRHRSNTVTSTFRPRNSATKPDHVAIRRMQSVRSDVVGQVTCIAGRNTAAPRCGEILSRSYLSPPQRGSKDPVRYSNGREVDVICRPGDSGGSAYFRSEARGLVSASVDRSSGSDSCVYTHISPALARMGLTLYTGG